MSYGKEYGKGDTKLKWTLGSISLDRRWALGVELKISSTNALGDVPQPASGVRFTGTRYCGWEIGREDSGTFFDMVVRDEKRIVETFRVGRRMSVEKDVKRLLTKPGHAHVHFIIATRYVLRNLR